MQSVGIARAAKGDVTPAGEGFCEILRKTSDKATAVNLEEAAADEPRHKRKTISF